MSRRRLRVERALEALPDLIDLAPLREALVDASRVDADEAWGGSRAYSTVGRRLADPGRVEAMIPGIADQLRLRAERVLQHAVGALRALQDGDAAAAAHALIAAGEIEEAAWRLEEAELYYRKALELGRKPRDRRGEALALKRLGRLARTRGDLAEALRLYSAGYQVSEAARDLPGMVVGSLGVGNVYVDQGAWAEARTWYLRGLEHLNDRGTPEFLHLCNALSVVERRLDHFDESERWLSLGEAEASRVDDPVARRYLQHGRARLHVARGELAEAELLLRGMLVGEADTATRITARINLAEPLMLQHRVVEAEGVLREAETLALRYGSVRQLAYVYEQMGRLAGARRDPEGFLFFEQSLDLIRQHRLPRSQEAAVQHAYGLFEAEVGSPESALARLGVAAQEFQEVGAKVDADRVEADINGIRGELRQVEESAAPPQDEKESRR